jgi:hypothetical protein
VLNNTIGSLSDFLDTAVSETHAAKIRLMSWKSDIASGNKRRKRSVSRVSVSRTNRGLKTKQPTLASAAVEDRFITSLR